VANLFQMTRGCEYAIAAITCIASQPEGSIVSSDLISECARIPRQFASNVLGQLAKAGLLCAHRGQVRGYSLARPAKDISFLEVIEAYDGPFIKPWCLLDSKRRCSDTNPCALHGPWHRLKDLARADLSRLTIAEIEEMQRLAAERDMHALEPKAGT
jgi:Rrf2 family protein